MAQSGIPLAREIWLSEAAAGLELELEARETPLSVTFEGGQITVGNDVIGRYIIDGLLERAWRALMGEATGVSDARLGSLLVDWSPPTGLEGTSVTAASQLDAALEAAFAGRDVQAAAAQAAAQSTDAALTAAREAGEAAVAAQAQTVDRLESQVRELERDLRRTRSRTESRSRGWWSHIASGLRGLLATFVSFLILAGGGWVAVRALPSRFEAASAAVRQRPVAVFGAGLAGAFLSIPVFFLGGIALLLSVVGILAIPFWALGYPLLVFGMVVFGYLVFARVLGEWVSIRTSGDGLAPTGSSPFGYLIAGVLVLLSFTATASVIGMFGPWVHWLSALLLAFGSFFTFFSTVMGFGAVILTRGGQWDHTGDPEDSPSWHEVDVEWDADPEFDDAPFGDAPSADPMADDPVDADAASEEPSDESDEPDATDDESTGRRRGGR